jgi:membrane protein
VQGRRAPEPTLRACLSGLPTVLHISHEPQARPLRPRCHAGPLLIPLKGWWQVAQRVWIESGRDNLSVAAAGCAFYALFAVFPALSALIALYGLTADPATVEQQFGMLKSVLPPQAYDIVIDQIRRVAEVSSHSLGWGLVFSLGLALWSVGNLIQAIFTALNIAYEEPERRSLLQFYLSAFGFALLGIVIGALMLFALVYLPILFAYAGFSSEFEILVKLAAAAGPACPHHACLALSLRSLPPQRQVALG